jgi:drug/metabolite transporter (DMT)-like permease
VGPFALAILVGSGVPAKLALGGEVWLSLFYIFLLGAFGTTFAMILFNKLIHITTAVFATTITYLIPVTAVVWGFVDGESIFPLHFAGMFLIIAGVYLINKFR